MSAGAPVSRRFAGRGVLVTGAASGIGGGTAGLFDQTAGDVEAVPRVDLLGPFLAPGHAGPRMAARGAGAIGCTGSVAGLRAGAGGPACAASRAGVVRRVQTAAQQLAGMGVRADAVCPGLVETGMTRCVFDGARERTQARRAFGAAPARPARGDRPCLPVPGLPVPGLRRVERRHRPGPGGRGRPFGATFLQPAARARPDHDLRGHR